MQDNIPILSLDKLIRLSNPCKGTYSIQKEITKVAFKEDIRLMNNPAWVEQMRLKLRSIPGAKWCDNVTNECHCKEET